MKCGVPMALCAALAVACSGNAPIGAAGQAGTGGGAGIGGGASGTFGAAGTFGGGSGIAGTGAAGASAVAGTTGAVTGIAGASGTDLCRAFGDPTLPAGKCVSGAYKKNGVCTCQAAAPNVCGDRCVDVLTDDDNCGCCGHLCGPASTCNDGKCGPAPVTLTAALPGCGRLDLATDHGALVWTDRAGGTVSQMATTNGTVYNLAAGESQPQAVAFVGGTAYWLAGNAIRRASPGVPPSTVFVNPFPVSGFVVSPDGAFVYFSSGTQVMRVATNDPTSLRVVAQEEHGGIPMALALYGDRLVYPTGLDDGIDVATLTEGKVARCGIPTDSWDLTYVDCLRVGRSMGELLMDKIVARPDVAIWADGSLLRMSATIGLPPIDNDTIAYVDETISGFATATMTVYFSAVSDLEPTAGVIYKAPIDREQTPIRIARGQNQPRSVAVDASRVYWSTGDCAIIATTQ